MLGIGVIGTGVIFENHASAVESLASRGRLVGVADADKAKRLSATKNHFVPVECEDYRDLLARDDIDVISICTPPSLHEEMAIAALEAGKYVVCEKPLAHTLASADRIIEATQRHPGKLSTVFQLRYMPEIQRIIWLRDQGRLGKLLFGNCVRFDCLAQSAGAASGWWGRWNTSGGGVVMTQFIHHLDQIIHIFGTPVEVTASMDTLHEKIESEDAFATSIRFENGALVNCAAIASSQGFGWSLDVVGAEMSAHYPWALKCRNKNQSQQTSAELARAFPAAKVASTSLPARAIRKIRREIGWGGQVARSGGHHKDYYRAVFDAIERGEALPIPACDARRSLELCTAIYQSAITAETVLLPLGTDCPFYEGVNVDAFQMRKTSKENAAS